MCKFIYKMKKKATTKIAFDNTLKDNNLIRKNQFSITIRRLTEIYYNLVMMCLENSIELFLV